MSWLVSANVSYSRAGLFAHVNGSFRLGYSFIDGKIVVTIAVCNFKSEVLQCTYMYCTAGSPLCTSGRDLPVGFTFMLFHYHACSFLLIYPKVPPVTVLR